LDGIRRLEDAGVAAVVLYSLFAEQIMMAERPFDTGTGQNNLALSYFPRWDRDPVGPDGYLDYIRLAKRSVRVPIIGSLNGAAPGDWTRFARAIEEAGADALELNIYHVPTDFHQSGAAVEQMYVDLVSEVKRGVRLPVAVKIGPHFSSIPAMAQRLVEAGADALVLFNRFYQPDFDLESRQTGPHLVLSDLHDLRLPLRWIGLLYGHLPVDLALTSGVHSQEDALKALMAGATVAMMASELLQNGVGRAGEILRDMTAWMEAHGYVSVDQIRGILSERGVADPAASERAGYAKVMQSLKPEAADPFVDRIRP
jgi:dihydroorotate dehydrogenase (fumarate)